MSDNQKASDDARLASIGRLIGPLSDMNDASLRIARHRREMQVAEEALRAAERDYEAAGAEARRLLKEIP